MFKSKPARLRNDKNCQKQFHPTSECVAAQGTSSIACQGRADFWRKWAWDREVADAKHADEVRIAAGVVIGTKCLNCGAPNQHGRCTYCGRASVEVS
jgi:hypothetical protein